MHLIKICLFLCFGLATLSLQAQIPAPSSVSISMELPKNLEGKMTISPMNIKKGKVQLPNTTYDVIVIVELEVDQALQSLQLQIKEANKQQIVLDQTFDLIATNEVKTDFALQRNGKIISINLGDFQLPDNYRCEVKVAQVDGQVSPVKVYNGSL